MSINDLRRCVGRPQNSPTGWLKVSLGRSLRVLGSSPVLASARQVIVKYCIINACCLMRQLNGQSRRFLLTNSLKCLMMRITRLDSDLLGRPRAGCTARHGRTTRGNLSSTCRFLPRDATLAHVHRVPCILWVSPDLNPKDNAKQTCAKGLGRLLLVTE